MLQPNDLPLVCLPLDLPPAAVAELVAFLHELTEASNAITAPKLKRHYAVINNAHRPVDSDDSPF